MQSLFEIGTVVHQHISVISYYLPLERGAALHLNEDAFPSHRDPFRRGLQGEEFQFCECIFTILLLSPIKEGVALH